MRDDHSKQLELLKDRSNSTEIPSQTSTINNVNSKIVRFFTFKTHFQTTTVDNRQERTSSDPPSDRETLIKQYYSQKIVDLETKLQLANGKGIAFYNEVKSKRYFFIRNKNRLTIVSKYSSTFETFERSRNQMSFGNRSSSTGIKSNESQFIHLKDFRTKTLFRMNWQQQLRVTKNKSP